MTFGQGIIMSIQQVKVQMDKKRNMNFSHDQRWSRLVAPLMLFMVMGAANNVMAEQPLTVDVSPCVNIKSAIERLDCYDELAHQARQTRSDREAVDLIEPEAAVVQRSPAVEQVPVTERAKSEIGRVTEENFGLPPEKREDETDLIELHATISKLEEYIPDRYLITLENGQVWRQMVAKRYQLRVGYNVRIYPMRWGESFRLSAEGKEGFIQVERVR